MGFVHVKPFYTNVTLSFPLLLFFLNTILFIYMMFHWYLNKTVTQTQGQNEIYHFLSFFFFFYNTRAYTDNKLQK